MYFKAGKQYVKATLSHLPWKYKCFNRSPEIKDNVKLQSVSINN